MTYEQFLWAKLAEESAEIAQAALKAQRNGYRGKYKTNLIEEMADLVSALRLLSEQGIEFKSDERRITQKMGIWKENYAQMRRKEAQEPNKEPESAEKVHDSHLSAFIEQTDVYCRTCGKDFEEMPEHAVCLQGCDYVQRKINLDEPAEPRDDGDVTGCMAYQTSDSMVCDHCAMAWDVDGLNAPECDFLWKKLTERG